MTGAAPGRTLIGAAGKNGGSSVSPELMKLAPRYMNRGYSDDDRSEQIKKWTPWLQRCLKKMDVDYKALRRREALLARAPEVKAIVSPLLSFFLVTLALWIRQRMIYGR